MTLPISAFVNPNAVPISLSQTFVLPKASTDPPYLVLVALDRAQYNAGASGVTGSLSGNGNTLNLSSIGGDARGAGIIFTYQSSTGRYYNDIYGYLDQLTFSSSSSAGDVTNLSLFASSSLSQATADVSSAYAMAENDAAGYLGSVTVVTQPRFTGTVPAQATPNSIAAIANSFIGKAWNLNGCWILASTIAADAGASLPIQSTLVGLPGQSNSEWIVAFNGPAGQTGNWQSMVTAGEIVVFGTSDGGGHITTCVSGSGSTAMLVDNITYVNSLGQIQNPANDGSTSDVIVAAPHPASQEWAGVQTSSVVIYQLDTPGVTDTLASDTLYCQASAILAPLFTVTDPAHKAITEWQVYNTAASDTLVFNGSEYADHSASSALTVTSLAAVSLLAGSTPTTDILNVRAYNGSYWGDWTALSVSVAPVPAPPPGEVVLKGASTQYIIADDNGLLYIQDTVAGRDGTQVLSGVTLIDFSNGNAVFDPTGSAEDVARLYHAALGRQPDVAGLQYWTSETDELHVPLSAISDCFVASPEFLQHYGSLSDQTFVNQLYTNVLNRPADTGGLQYWDNALASGMPRGAVLMSFSQSPEYEAATLSIGGDTNNAEAYRLHQAALGRAPDAGELSYWAAQLANGATPTQIAQTLIDSAEFRQDFGTLSASDFVSTLYRNATHRAGDPVGLQYWTNVLQQGGSRASVAVSFANSTENRIDTAAATHANWVFIEALP